MRKRVTNVDGKHKELNGERIINISETAKREANNRNNESELRNPSHSFSRSYRIIFHQD